jgi:hypothetical protein
LEIISQCDVKHIRERPFNLKGGLEGGGYGLLFRSENFFWTTQELEYLYFLSCKAQIFFPEFNIRLYDKNSESEIYLNQLINHGHQMFNFRVLYFGKTYAN